MSFRFPIVRPVLPNVQQYQQHVDSVFKRAWLTNGGPLHQELEQRLAGYLQVENLMLVSNGTLALQVAYKALDMGRDVLTTPFSFAATASSLAWQQHQCHFVDIDTQQLNLDIQSATKEQQQKAQGIVATHVFGNPCQVEILSEFAEQKQIPLIYDAAHAFGARYKGQSLLNYGDASTLSLHATKIFHTVEGGAIIFKDEAILEKAKQLINFGFDKQQMPTQVGINTKLSEVHAAMGLALLDTVAQVQQHRIDCVIAYQSYLQGFVEFQQWHKESSNNGAYMPLLCQSESELLQLAPMLAEKGIQTRRYFYPSLSSMSCYDLEGKGEQGKTPIANEISLRVLCLPLYADLTLENVKEICLIVRSALQQIRD